MEDFVSLWEVRGVQGSVYNGWKLGLPDKFWPVAVDNFFDNPDEVRELGLHMLELDSARNSAAAGGQWPGRRSDQVWNKDEKLAEMLTEKILSCYFNLDFEQVFFQLQSLRFHLISRLDDDKNSRKNKGWIHRDSTDPRMLHHPNVEVKVNKKGPSHSDSDSTDYRGPTQLAGLIYLTPDIERNTGTSLFNMKKDKTLEDWDKTTEIRKEIHLGNPVNDKEAKEQWENHRSCFDEKIRFENNYNSMIMYDANEWHAANNYYTSKNNRLTLGFFLGGIRANKWPLERVKNI